MAYVNAILILIHSFPTTPRNKAVIHTLYRAFEGPVAILQEKSETQCIKRNVL
jgi:hypothetical protein